MNQIDKFIIQNFQCHTETVVELSYSGLTVITGPTDHGKSAVVRAILWLFYNHPQGDEFIRHGAKECKVTAEMASGIKVIRRRTVSLNQYWIDDQVYEGFGNKVPLEVQQVLGVYSYDVASKRLNLNIAKQLDGPFLGNSITAPTRAKILGKLAGTETIDRASKQLGTDIYRAGQRKKQLEENIKKDTKDIKEYNWVPVLGKALKKAEKKLEQIKKSKDQMKHLQEIRNELCDLKVKKMELDNNLTLLIYVNEAQGKLNQINIIEIKLQRLKEIKSELQHLKCKKQRLNTNLQKLQSTKMTYRRLSKLENNFIQYQKLLKIYTELQQLSQQKQRFNSNLNKLTKVHKYQEIIKQIQLDIQQQKRLENIYNKLSSFTKKKQLLEQKYNQLKNSNQALNLINKIKENNERLSKKKKQLKKWKGLNKTIEDLRKLKKKKTKKIKKLGGKVRECKQQYIEYMKNERICSRCGSKVNEENIRRVI